MRAWDGPGPPARLPAQVTSFVDRECELAKILELLARPETRLVSLTGPGGVGKTQLALRAVVTAASDAGASELIWISLASMERAEQVAHAIGEAFALKGSDRESLAQRLAVTLLERRALLLLDNFEHLQDAAILIAEILAACPTLTILVTSRGPLHLSGEREIALDPLDLPHADGKVEEIAASPAVQLFLTRAPVRFETEPPNEEQLRAISTICRRLDGLPLAIELAAAWCRLLTPAQLLSRLDRRLPILTDGPVDAPARLQTMRNAIDWSYAFLDESEQKLFCALCVFVEGFTLEAAEHVAQFHGDPSLGPITDPGSTVRGLAQLVQQGLVRAPQLGRFTMLQTIREFGLETLAHAGELDTARRAHLAWCAGLAGEPTFEPLDGYIWSLSSLASEQAELIAALDFALESGDTASALKLASGLAPIWAEQGRYGEARSALDRIVRESPALDPGVRAIITGWEAEWAWLQGDFRATGELAGRALETCQALQMDAAIAANLYRLGRVATLYDPPSASPLLEGALDYYRSTEEARASCWCMIALGHVAIATGESRTAEQWLAAARQTLSSFEDGPGAWLTLSSALAEARLALIEDDHDRARPLVHAALRESRTQHNLFYESLALVLWCQIALRQHDVAAAASAGREGLQIAQQLGSSLRQWQCLDQLTGVAHAAGQPERAILLHGATMALGEHLQGIRSIAAAGPGEPGLDTLDGAIDQERRNALIRTGRRLTDAETLAEVLALERETEQQQPGATQLSKRELEVLALLAGGVTNTAIAGQLFLSSRTVDTHVGSILRKLQVASRLEAVEAARERGLIVPNTN